ncbi:hypothetical protein BDV29DRAFT_157448 [Aspergillus leporis]|uniref:Alcohol dehydrogenase-like C-terminal domain-containing protein n=1 Tax=Aspergillus leporis TaxID=41062 RepID=A0A5N5X2K7_9EURO|nr:hypothetical protein BDV29DRAFT_157448 [Aspergillus leporis]
MAFRLVLTEPHSNLTLQACDRPTPAQDQLEVEIPECTSFEVAAAIPFSMSAAACGLFLALGLQYKAPFAAGTHIVIWGATRNVGSFTVQLAKLVGYSVIAITSSES